MDLPGGNRAPSHTLTALERSVPHPTLGRGTNLKGTQSGYPGGPNLSATEECRGGFGITLAGAWAQSPVENTAQLTATSQNSFLLIFQTEVTTKILILTRSKAAALAMLTST